VIRPSQLQFAETCAYAAKLSEEYPETGEAADRGMAIHAEIAAALKGGAKPTTPEAKSAVAWLCVNFSEAFDHSMSINKGRG
jgi:RecB family exonuclease